MVHAPNFGQCVTILLHKKLMQECVQESKACYWIVKVTCPSTPNILTPNQITFEKERGKI